MYCPNCGSKLPDGVKFCPNCGASVEGLDDEENNGSQNPNFNENSQRSRGSDGREDRRTEDGRKKFITPRNMEVLAAVSLLFPVFAKIVLSILRLIGRQFYFWGGMYFDPLELNYFFMRLIEVNVVIVCVIFFIASLLGLLAAIYAIVVKYDNQTVWGLAAGIAALLAFLSTLGTLRFWGAVSIVFMVIAAVFSVDLISRVCIQKMGLGSTPDIGRDLHAYREFFSEYKAAHPTGNKAEQDRIANDPYASYFDGNGAALLGYYILVVITELFTLGIATPWVLCKIFKWRKTHTVINGRHLDFNGTGTELLGYWILWSLLTIITLGVFSFFQHVALRKWELKHTIYPDAEIRYADNAGSFFDGNSFQYFGYGLLNCLVSLVTIGIAAPWTKNLIYSWEAKHSVVCGDRMYYDGSALGLFIQYIVVWFLSIITLGIYYAWGQVRLMKFQYRHYQVKSTEMS